MKECSDCTLSILDSGIDGMFSGNVYICIVHLVIYECTAMFMKLQIDGNLNLLVE